MELPVVTKLLWLFLVVPAVFGCNRKPKGATGERSPVDENFQILIDGNPATYIPGQQYNVSLSCAGGLKFISFTMVAESESATPPTGYDMLGRFELLDSADTKFSTNCENMIENTNTNAKSRIDIAWVAPTNPDGSCILIKAAVLQHRNVWFIDDGFLTKRICPEETDELNGQTPAMTPCCACDEAKYEILLERRWTRNTHAKDFPSEAWRTRFSEIIGASHTSDYRFWEYGSRASQGLREMGEHGATQNLEAEIKANINSGNIRTIIKAPGISYRQNVVGTTLANVRVDPQHHFISLVTKVYPSPDWILGVAGLEVCLPNCTWIERKVLNLYPWDIGTDAGASYMSPDQPQLPPDVIRRITSTFPSDYRSPFYDDTGAPMKPLGVLYITRRKLYERECDVEQNVPVECAVHPWNAWNECSTKCGPGTQHRVRAYKDVRLATSFNCQMVLRQIQNCIGDQCGSLDDAAEQRRTSAECELGNWSGWSTCSKRCGKGYATRQRDYKNPFAREKCQSAISIELEQIRDCFGNDCGGTIRGNFDNTEDIIGPQFDNINEPGNTFNNRAPGMYDKTNSGSYGERTTNNYQETSYGSEVNSYGTSQADYTNMDTSRNFNSNFPRLRNTPNYNSPVISEDQGVPLDSIYGSEKLVGSSGVSKFDRNQYSGNLETNQPYGARNMEFNAPYKSSTERYNQQTGSLTTTRSPFFGFDSNTANRQRNSMTNNAQFGDIYDESMHAINYNVIQEYCFEKPTASLDPCRRDKVVISNYWFYDAEDRECKIFTADNCDENKNKFRTLEACEGTCHKPQQNLAEISMGNENWSSANSGQPPQNLGGNIKSNNQNWPPSSYGKSKQREQWPSDFGEPQSQVQGYQNRKNYG